MVPSTDASKQNTSEAGCVGCAGVWGCEDMGVMSGDSGDLGDASTTASTLESSTLMIHWSDPTKAYVPNVAKHILPSKTVK